MQALSELFLKCTVDKTSAKSDWKQNPLPLKLLQYAATDVKVGMCLLEVMKPLAEQVSGKSTALSLYGITPLKTGDSVVYYINGVDRARGTIEHAGSRLEKRSYGTLANIPHGKVLVRLMSVIRGNTRPMESFTLTKEEKSGGLLSGWTYPKRTLHKIWTLWKGKKQAPLLVLPLGCIKIYFCLADNTIPATSSKDDATGSPHSNNNRDEQNVDETSKTPPSTQAIPQYQADGDPSLNDHLDDDDTLPASKDKYDIFHPFQSFPMNESEAEYTLITRLLIHTTFEMDPTDFPLVAAHLAKKKDICTEDAIIDHFYYNREWWQRCIKMKVPDRESHAQAVRNLHEFVKKFISSYDAKVADYFDYFEREKRERLFDEGNDL